MSIGTQNPAIYTDFSGLADLRRRARDDSDGALREVAQQFEAIFVQMMLKSMRDATPEGGLFDNDQTKMYREMFDQQVSLSMSGRGGLGLTDAIVRQLRGDHPRSETDLNLETYRQRPVTTPPLHRPEATDSATAGEGPAAGSPEATPRPEPQAKVPAFQGPADFIAGVWPHAKAAARELGVEPRALVAQAALETGWGQHVMARPDGNSTYNLFGIKADHRWEGERVSARTLEFENGVMVPRTEAFRAYGSLAEAFDDYVQFLRTQPRYQAALGQADSRGFSHSLQRAGYATDPDYANKIMAILEGDTFQQALGGLKL